MIFVTVGNATQEFRRLIHAADTLAGTGLWGGEPVFMQTGHTRAVRPQHSECQAFLSMNDFQARMEEAAVIICHAGCGTLLHAVRLGKVPVVMPRRKKYGEHVNDHQMQLAQVLASEGRIIPAYEPDELMEAVSAARHCRPQSQDALESPLIALVSTAIDELMDLNTNR